MKWIILIAALVYFYRTGKKEAARREAEKRRLASAIALIACDERQTTTAPLDTIAKGGLPAALTKGRRPGRWKAVAINASDERSNAEQVLNLDTAADKAQRTATRIKSLRQELEATSRDIDIEPNVVEPEPDPYDGTLPAPAHLAPPPEPLILYAIADDSNSDAVNAEVRKEIERTASASAPKPARPRIVAAATSQLIVRDSVIMQTLLERHPRNPMFWKRR